MRGGIPFLASLLLTHSSPPSFALLEYVPPFTFTNALIKSRSTLLANNSPTAIAYASFSLTFLARHAASDAVGKGYDAIPYGDAVRPWFMHIDERAESIVGDFEGRADEGYNTRNAGLLALGFANLGMGAEEGGFGFLSALDGRAESIGETDGRRPDELLNVAPADDDPDPVLTPLAADKTSAEDLANFLTYFAVGGEADKAARLLRLLCLKRLFTLEEESSGQGDWVANEKAIACFFGAAKSGDVDAVEGGGDHCDDEEDAEEDDEGILDNGEDGGDDDVEDYGEDFEDGDDGVDDEDDDDYDDDDQDDSEEDDDGDDYYYSSSFQMTPELKVDAITNLLKSIEDLNITEVRAGRCRCVCVRVVRWLLTPRSLHFSKLRSCRSSTSCFAAS